MADNPLTPDQYQPGSTLEHEGERIQVGGTLRTAEGGSFLLVGQPDSPYLALLPEATVRDNEDDAFSPVDQETLDQEAEDRANQPDATDDPDGTGSDDSTTTQPQG